MAKLLGVVKSTIYFVGKKQEHQKAQKTTAVSNRRVISLEEKNSFTTIGHMKNTLQEVGVSVSKSTIERNHTRVNTVQRIHRKM